MKESRATSLGDRWRREVTRGIDERRLQLALQALPSIRQPFVRIGVGAITAELEGTMGSIHEVSIRVPPLPGRIWDNVARVLRRSTKMMEALQDGRVPLAFDRLVARIGGETVLPESRRVTYSCTCGQPETPCRHVLALHELLARRLDEKPWLLLQVRGINVRELIEKAQAPSLRSDVPVLAFKALEEPVLFPEAADGDLDSALTREQAASLVNPASRPLQDAVARVLASLSPAAVTATPTIAPT